MNETNQHLRKFLYNVQEIKTQSEEKTKSNTHNSFLIDLLTCNCLFEDENKDDCPHNYFPFISELNNMIMSYMLSLRVSLLIKNLPLKYDKLGGYIKNGKG